ncbi:DUF4468 domain-containing protein [Tenacibaculum piscium]|uniref:DUF4468 domain-containing protein n=1 Tax=Tenacibaculum piscium TaxID=1458515 RepID=UPI001F3F35E0|nr:DUF4468 domain-containing protein [Tenacibaculum piscium]
MKKIITVILILICTQIYSQKELTFKDGNVDVAMKYKERKGMSYYISKDGVTKTVKSKLIKKIKDLSLRKKSFEYNQLGLTDYVVTNIDSVSQEQLFERTINWIKETYKNPEKVIKTKIGNEKVRIEGFQDNTICNKIFLSTFCYGAKYTIEISVKDGKYKFDPTNLTYRIPYTKSGPEPSVNNISFNSGQVFYNRKGRLKSVSNSVPRSIEDLFNSLNLSLKNYVKSHNKVGVVKNDNW